jgi:hypothetical protein
MKPLSQTQYLFGFHTVHIKEFKYYIFYFADRTCYMEQRTFHSFNIIVKDEQNSNYDDRKMKERMCYGAKLL